MRGSRIRRPAMVGTALGGIALGHALTYLLAIRNHAHRGDHLASAGHGYWDTAMWVTGAVAIASLAWAFLRHLRGDVAEPSRRDVTASVATTTLLQLAGFVLLEVGERIAAGAPLEGVLDHRLLIVGLGVQLVVAVLGSLFLRWLARAAEVLRELLWGRAENETSTARVRASEAWVRYGVAPLSGGSAVRGPPVRLAATVI